jgi:alpha-tubulin suppressor-like RCC1 family protein
VTGGLAFRSLATTRDTLAPGYTCGVTTSDELYCWGYQEPTLRRLGVADFSLSLKAPRRVDGNHVVGAVAVAYSRGCQVTLGGALHCWGTDVRGTARVSLAPVLVEATRGFRSVALGEDVTCALDVEGRAFCLRLGQPGPDFVEVPGALRFRTLSAYGATVCGLTHAGVAYCWGASEHGQIGDGSTAARAVPTRVAAEHRFAEISVGAGHTCAVTLAGDGFCWGNNDAGQLGTGSTARSLVPVRVAPPPGFRP